MDAGRNHSASCIFDMHEAITFDAQRSDSYPLQFLPAIVLTGYRQMCVTSIAIS